jgi:hypothetical protein
MKTTLMPIATIHHGRKHFTIVNANDPTDRTRMTKRTTARLRKLCEARRWTVGRLMRWAIRCQLKRREAEAAAA